MVRNIKRRVHLIALHGKELDSLELFYIKGNVENQKLLEVVVLDFMQKGKIGLKYQSKSKQSNFKLTV